MLVLEGGVPRELHLANLVCPELTQPFGIEAATWLAERCEGREIVVLERLRDTLGIHGHVFVDGVNLNVELAQAGYAHVFNPSTADAKIVEAVDEAVYKFRGIWKAFAPPIEPGVWMKLTRDIAPSDEFPLNGVWEVTSAQWMGRPNPGSVDARYIFRGGTVTICEPPETIERKFVLNPAADPAEINYTQQTANGPVEILGIYRFEGDQLTLCNSRQGQERPRVFASSTTEVGCSLIDLRRVRVPERFGRPKK